MSQCADHGLRWPCRLNWK